MEAYLTLAATVGCSNDVQVRNAGNLESLSHREQV